MQNKLILVLVLFVVILIAGGILAWQKYEESAQSPAESGKIESILIPAEDDGTEVSKTTEANPVGNSEPAAKTMPTVPSLTRALPAGVDAAIAAKITELSKTIEGNTDYLDGWLQLGMYRRDVKDYEGAREAWAYASAIRPHSAVPLINLGDLYGYYIHDNAKAEVYFLKAVDAEPTNAYTYYRTYEFYADINEISKARKILEQGIAQNPKDSQDLENALKNL